MLRDIGAGIWPDALHVGRKLKMKNYKKPKYIKEYLRLVSLGGFMQHEVVFINSPKGRKKIKNALKKVEEDPEIKITHIGKRWHACLYHNNILIDEMACELKVDINIICKELLRWYNKIGDSSSMDRNNVRLEAEGKIWYQQSLKLEQAINKKSLQYHSPRLIR
jgi:hypothetical protein